MGICKKRVARLLWLGWLLAGILGLSACTLEVQPTAPSGSPTQEATLPTQETVKGPVAYDLVAADWEANRELSLLPAPQWEEKLMTNPAAQERAYFSREITLEQVKAYGELLASSGFDLLQQQFQTPGQSQDYCFVGMNGSGVTVRLEYGRIEYFYYDFLGEPAEEEHAVFGCLICIYNTVDYAHRLPEDARENPLPWEECSLETPLPQPPTAYWTDEGGYVTLTGMRTADVIAYARQLYAAGFNQYVTESFPGLGGYAFHGENDQGVRVQLTVQWSENCIYGFPTQESPIPTRVQLSLGSYTMTDQDGTPTTVWAQRTNGLLPEVRDLGADFYWTSTTFGNEIRISGMEFEAARQYIQAVLESNEKQGNRVTNETQPKVDDINETIQWTLSVAYKDRGITVGKTVYFSYDSSNRDAPFIIFIA